MRDAYILSDGVRVWNQPMAQEPFLLEAPQVFLEKQEQMLRAVAGVRLEVGDSVAWGDATFGKVVIEGEDHVWVADCSGAGHELGDGVVVERIETERIYDIKRGSEVTALEEVTIHIVDGAVGRIAASIRSNGMDPDEEIPGGFRSPPMRRMAMLEYRPTEGVIPHDRGTLIRATARRWSDNTFHVDGAEEIGLLDDYRGRDLLHDLIVAGFDIEGKGEGWFAQDGNGNCVELYPGDHRSAGEVDFTLVVRRVFNGRSDVEETPSPRRARKLVIE